MYVGTDDATDAILVYVFKNKTVQRFTDWKAFPRMFPFRDTDVLINKRAFSAKEAMTVHKQDNTEEQESIALSSTEEFWRSSTCPR